MCDILSDWCQVCDRYTGDTIDSLKDRQQEVRPNLVTLQEIGDCNIPLEVHAHVTIISLL